MQFTPENRSRLRGTVFGKTAAGRQEVTTRGAGLSARQRSVLILLDGRKSLGQIETWLTEEEMLEAIETLVRMGLIAIESQPAPVAAASPKIKPAAPAPAPVPALASLATAPVPAVVLEAATLMRDSAKRHLGLMAADLIRRIDNARDVPQLTAVLGLWHVTLRESKRGRDEADVLLASTRALLGQA
jgi:hypothetical protein